MSRQPIPTITLTSFLQYTARRTQPAKVNYVKNLKEMYSGEYRQARDAYRRLRRQILAARGGELDIDDVLSDCLDRDKVSYELLAKNHNKVITTIGGECVRSRSMTWSHDELSVKINPELAFRNSDVTTFYKLHLTQQIIHKDSLGVIFQLLAESISDEGDEAAAFADLRGGRILLMPNSVPSGDLALAVRLDAEQFIRTWHLI